FVVACDMPFASRKLASQLKQTLIEKELDAVIPVEDGKIHPLCAVYDAGIHKEVMTTLKEGKRAVKSLLDRIDVKYIGMKKSLDFWNMNTREDYVEAKKIIEGNETH